MRNVISKGKYYDTIQNIVKNDKISHAYLIEVSDYDDFSSVLDFVKLILCKAKKYDFKDNSCIDCNICKQVDSGTYVDLKIIEPDGSYIKKNQLIELQENFKNKSFLDNKMIYIIKEADKLNDSSANTILKFLEEPEDDIIAILVTTNRYKIIDTILSRCQIITLHCDNLLTDISDDIVDLVNFIINGNDLFINYNYIYNNILPDKNAAKDVFGVVEKILVNYLNYISNPDDFSFDTKSFTILTKIDSMNIVNIIDIIEEEIKKLDYNVNYKLWLDCLFARFIGG